MEAITATKGRAGGTFTQGLRRPRYNLLIKIINLIDPKPSDAKSARQFSTYQIGSRLTDSNY
ncbi:hypothetical protein CHELA20_50051 [Hyphomicrobiales bacterium]|nr:hypothetical protein CHELA41_20321 [Hyphomicrobiales bacterium]CAH1666342.1 hypothetical protein CHELA20_50051 [Hyphomicrobiales bacterium]